ncbi:LexA family transcriptional regulator [Flavobacterium sp.]
MLNKLKKTLKINSDKQLSEFLNVKPNTISTWKKRNSLDYSVIISICELYEIDLNEIFYDSGKYTPDSICNSSETPLVSREILFQYCVDSSAVMENLPKFNFPFIHSDNSRVFQVVSNNMYPIIEENSFVICEGTTIELVQENSLVVIVSKSKGLFVKRIHRSHLSPDLFLLSSENKFYDTLKLDKAAIDEIWSIKGILTYNVTNDNKTKFINDSIKLLDKALMKIKTDDVKK